MMTINTTLDTETATLIASDFGADVEMLSFEEDILQVESEDLHPEDMVSRAPVVTVMGHVDHGKTSLLDTIRKTRVAEREAGGITQHIGAYSVITDGRPVVFLDTPGHEAFTMMRARGAKVTDVVILVVAADDGVMPQTREAIDHAKAANVPIIVAVNKIDKADANPELVKKELAELDLVPEAWGGQTVLVEVSAKNNQNLDQLLEMVLLVTDMGEFKANPKRNATGTVLEAKIDRGRGPVATIIVQDGTLNVGDTFIAGTSVGKVRALIDDRGRQVKSAPPSTPVEVLGLGGIPQPGDTFQALTDTVKARQIAVLRQAQAKEKALGGKGTRLTLESLQSQIAEGSVKELPIIIKADVQGSTEVLSDTLTKLSDERVKILIIHSGVGAISESDVLLASASNAIIIGFSIRPDRNATDIAEREHVDIRLHSIIYKVTDEIKKAMAGLLEPTIKEVHLGRAEVRETFKVPKFGTIAGCIVTDGRITRSGEAQARLLRDSVVIFEGPVGSLRRFKDDVNEVKAGVECGIAFDRFNDIKVGDTIEAFSVEKIAATI
jgi:translation initiation factor IF-2